MSKSLTWRRLIDNRLMGNPQAWVGAACVALLLLLIGSEVWTTSRAFFYRPAISATPPANADTSRSSVEHIIAAELFGRAPAQSGNQTLPETNLQLTLRGVFTSADSRSASAMIEGSDGRAQIVKTGANVASDTVLQEVFSNRVILVRNGVPESLYFPTPQSGIGENSIAQTDALPNADTAAGLDDSSAGASPEELKRAAILRRLEELRARNSH